MSDVVPSGFNSWRWLGSAERLWNVCRCLAQVNSANSERRRCILQLASFSWAPRHKKYSSCSSWLVAVKINRSRQNRALWISDVSGLIFTPQAFVCDLATDEGAALWVHQIHVYLVFALEMDWKLLRTGDLHCKNNSETGWSWAKVLRDFFALGWFLLSGLGGADSWWDATATWRWTPTEEPMCWDVWLCRLGCHWSCFHWLDFAYFVSWVGFYYIALEWFWSGLQGIQCSQRSKDPNCRGWRLWWKLRKSRKRPDRLSFDPLATRFHDVQIFFCLPIHIFWRLRREFFLGGQPDESGTAGETSANSHGFNKNNLNLNHLMIINILNTSHPQYIRRPLDIIRYQSISFAGGEDGSRNPGGGSSWSSEPRGNLDRKLWGSAPVFEINEPHFLGRKAFGKCWVLTFPFVGLFSQKWLGWHVFCRPESDWRCFSSYVGSLRAACARLFKRNRRILPIDMTCSAK